MACLRSTGTFVRWKGRLSLLCHAVSQVEERDCENKLVILLDYDKFDLIKLLLRHRHKVPHRHMLARQHGCR